MRSNRGRAGVQSALPTPPGMRVRTGRRFMNRAHTMPLCVAVNLHPKVADIHQPLPFQPIIRHSDLRRPRARQVPIPLAADARQDRRAFTPQREKVQPELVEPVGHRDAPAWPRQFPQAMLEVRECGIRPAQPGDNTACMSSCKAGCVVRRRSSAPPVGFVVAVESVTAAPCLSMFGPSLVIIDS